MNSKTIELDAARWLRLQELFDVASNLAPGKRVAYLDEACIDDEPLRNYVLGMLNAETAVHSEIEQTIANTLAVALGDDALQPDEFHGEMIGHYKIRRMLGSGGMGMVYLAERADEQFDQNVAIKVGRHRLVDPQVELRLRNERQILADLDHPNIARLFDGGTTDDGVPYLVMEYIDGVRIDNYCDRNRLDVAARLKLFQTICAAVHYAHENLVIHRDIKASNILVTADGTPKLLDFGIAKLIDTQGSAVDGLTREGAVIMTPSSAAPEQLLGKPVTTATDTYALGVLLYQLLAGVRALPTENLSPSEAARVICSADIARPSQQLEQKRHEARRDRATETELEQIADDRRTSIEKLQRRLRGDLDTIILNALRKEPERRYRSVSALSDDIDLHLKSRPIVARADSWRYRTGKFVRRHYAAVSTSALIVVLLASFTVALSVQNRKVIKERDTAREVSQFLEDIFMAQDPAHARGATVTADELLTAGANRIRRDLDGRPEIQSALMGTIGRVYFSLGEWEPSLQMLEDSLALRRRTYGDAHESVASAENDLAETLISLADYERAEALLVSALATNRKIAGADSPSVARNLFNLAEVHLKTGELDEAESYAGLSADLYAAYRDTHGVELAEAKNLLARILQVRGDLDRTEPLLLEAIEIVISSEGPNHPLMAYYLQNLGVLQRSKGDLAAAEATLDRAIGATRRILGDKHDLLAAALVDKGTLLHAKGDLANAERVIREALELDTETRGPAHPRVGYDMTVLGMVLHDMSELTAAENMLRHALALYDEALGDDHQYTASALTELGAVLNAAGQLAEAETLLERALAIRKKDYPAGHRLVAGTQVEYADTLSRLGFYDEAEALLVQSLAVLDDTDWRRQERAREALERLRLNRSLSPAL